MAPAGNPIVFFPVGCQSQRVYPSPIPLMKNRWLLVTVACVVAGDNARVDAAFDQVKLVLVKLR